MSEEKVEENVEEIKQVSNKFVNSIKNWVAIDDKIRKINNEMKKYKDELKILTSQKQEFEKLVLDELDKMDEKVISISDGKIRKNVSKTQKPLKKEDIQKTIFEFTKDEKKTFDIIEQMEKTRQTVEKINLKRTKNKESVIST
jgi:DNA repair ATPase RecN